MRIQRKKRIYAPDGSLSWAQTHAMNPTIDIMTDRIRVYFSSLDENKVGRISYVDLDKNNPEKIVDVAKNPVLDIGPDGTFDDNGVIPSSIITHNNEKYLFYYAFQLLKKEVRFMMFTGVAISKDGGKTFIKHSTTPVLDRNSTDTFIRSLAFVMTENNLFKVWYNGVNEWTDVKGKRLPMGNIRYLESASLLDLNSKPIHNCLSPQSHEFSLSRPYVFKHDNKYKMLFSSRLRDTDAYKLGYAESNDWKNWTRNDSVLQVSDPSGDWDSDMICYTSVINLNGKNYLFYNGNGFGATGFGYAEVNF